MYKRNDVAIAMQVQIICTEELYVTLGYKVQSELSRVLAGRNETLPTESTLDRLY